MRLPREAFIPKGALKVCDKRSDAVAYLSVSLKSGRPCATVFFGTQAKPVANFVYRDETQRERSVRDYFERRQAHLDRVKARRGEQKAFVHSVRVGDIFRTCWGYDQTNVEFFEVVEVKGKFAVLREIAVVADDNGHGNERVVPQSGKYLSSRFAGDEQGLPIRRLIQRGYQDKPSIKIDECRTASPWGERVAGAVVGAAVSRTAYGWGH